MFPSHANQYAEWRRRSGLVLSLREEGEPPPERLLQAIWFHQRVRREQLRLLDGCPVQVLHPGFWNREAGPDFRGAILQFGSEPACAGDVEIDLRSGDWRAHRHDANPAFKNVVLHVVWETDAAPGERTLALQPALDSPLRDLAQWLGSKLADSFPIELLGHCCAPLRGLPAERLGELLRQAAFLRLQAKAAHLQARARQAGWEQALWEGLFRALGYKQNLWPMQRLGELRPRLCPEGSKPAVCSLQARLLGVAGLLPEELTRAQARADTYLRRLWDCWWREREAFQDCALPRTLWKLSGLRPANQPQRRLALAAHWLTDARLPARLEKWCAGSASSVGCAVSTSTLFEILQVPTDEFWSRHWTLRSEPSDRPRPLLGATRVTDLAINVILPWLWSRAVEGKNQSLRQELERRYFCWPSAQDNAVLRLARQRLLGGASVRAVRGAAMQQGLLQIVRDFCEHSNALCAECQFPELVRQWPT